MPFAFTNPVLPGFQPDPSVCRVGEDYYLATSSFEIFPGLPIHHSRDLVNWQLVGHVLHRPAQINLSHTPSSKGIFAPTLRHHHGRFYLICTDVGGVENFILHATDPAPARGLIPFSWPSAASIRPCVSTTAASISRHPLPIKPESSAPRSTLIPGCS